MCIKRAAVSNCVAGDFGALVGLANPCPGAAFLDSGHTKRWATSFADDLVPGWDRSWTDWNTWRRKGAGTYGRGFPVDGDCCAGNEVFLDPEGRVRRQKIPKACRRFPVTRPSRRRKVAR
jgi:hypothetical protein